MKTPITVAILTALAAAHCYAWIHSIPDYQKQFEQADLVAVVRVSGVTNTGSTKRINEKSRLEFRECEVNMQIISAFKGDTTNSVKCRLYRFPTEAERDADLGKREAAIEYMKATPWESDLFVPKQWDHCLVYLKRSAAGSYRTVTGSSVHNILKLEVSFVTDPDKEAERNGAANRGLPVGH